MEVGRVNVCEHTTKMASLESLSRIIVYIAGNYSGRIRSLLKQNSATISLWIVLCDNKYNCLISIHYFKPVFSL